LSVDKVKYENLSIDGENENYINTANDYLSEHPSERFAWSFKKDLFNDFFTKQHPEVKTATIDNRITTDGTLKLKIREPVAVWKSSQNNYFVDADGHIFEINLFGFPEIEIFDQSNIGIANGSTASSRLLEFVGKVIAGINSSGVGKTKSVTIPATAIRYFEIKLDGYNFPIKVQTDRDPSDQVRDVMNMVEYLKSNNITPSYVDVRVRNRGFWK
jgi:hypothetical protein